MGRTNLYIYYLDKDKKSKEIRIKSIPEKISYSRTPEFSDISFLGRFSPVYVYKQGSAEVYTFSVTIHEDDLVGNEKNLEKRITHFVEDLKEVSFPVESTGKVKPQYRKKNDDKLFPYFQIGEIIGHGIIEVEASWRPPFRNGRYIVADLSFKVTIEERLEKVEPLIKQAESGEDIRFKGVPTTVYSTDYYKSYIDFYTRAGGTNKPQGRGGMLGVQEGNLVNFLIDPKESQLEYAKMKYVEQYAKVERLYNKIEAAVGGDFNKNTAKALNKLKINSTSFYDGIKPLQNAIKGIEKEIEKALEEYYKDNPYFLKEEQEAIIVEARRIFLGLEEIYKEAYTYGSGS